MPRPEHEFDFVSPDYAPIWQARIERLAKLMADPLLLEASKVHYKHNIPDFIQDWGVTVDPRNAGTVKPVIMPFILFPKQREFLEWLVSLWLRKKDGIEVKSRDCGASWLAMGFSVAMNIFWEDISIGFGSAKEDKVDRSGDPDCLFYKGRTFMQYVPPIYRGSWELKKHSSHMRLMFPDTGGSITGEAGDNIGRGGRKSIYFVDEFAFVERPKLVDASLSANTDCRVEMSSVQGSNNVFAERARGGLIERFDFHYRDDPRKTPEWIEKKKKSTDPIVWAAEYECDFNASVEGIIIPRDWVLAAIGAHTKLGITPSGVKTGSYDVADRGNDKNCYASKHGILLEFIESWSGKAGDIAHSVDRVFRLSDTRGNTSFTYDGDGVGAGVLGIARKANENREALNEAIYDPADHWKLITPVEFRGAGKIIDPERKVEGTDRKNEDFFENQKAQSWWALRHRFWKTYRWVTEGIACDPSEIISINPELPELTKTCDELSQPVWVWSKAGKMMVDKTPDEVASPNNADSVMMLYGYTRPALFVSDETLEAFGFTPTQENAHGF